MSIQKKSGLLGKLFWTCIIILLLSTHGVTLGSIMQFDWHGDLLDTFTRFFNTDAPQTVIPITASSSGT